MQEFIPTGMNQKFCSRSCQEKDRNARVRASYIPISKNVQSCLTCTIEFKPQGQNHQYCSAACRKRAMRKRYRENYHDVVLQREGNRIRVSVEEKLALLRAQNFRCAICQTEISLRGEDNKPVAHLDHDHKTMRIRGLLCSPCNRGLGCFHDSMESLYVASAYVSDVQVSRLLAGQSMLATEVA